MRGARAGCEGATALGSGRLNVAQVEGPDKATLFDQLIFSNVNDKTGQISNTISKKVRRSRRGARLGRRQPG